MIVGIGNDIVSIARIARILQKDNNQNFLAKIFTDYEVQLINDLPIHKLPGYVANRFAAKEAFAKAIGTGIGKHLAFKDISVIKNSQGKPYFSFNDKIKKFIDETCGPNFNIQLSMSNEREYAQAFVVIEKISF